MTRRTDPADAPTAAAITAADGTLLIDAPIIPVGGVMCHLGCACWLNWLYTEMAPTEMAVLSPVSQSETLPQKLQAASVLCREAPHRLKESQARFLD